MNLYLALTDANWFRFLRGRPDLDEVNFWQPGGGRHLRQLPAGAPFLFKLHAPEHFIVGGGRFRRSVKDIPLDLAWEAFGEKNGAASLAELREGVLSHRADRNPYGHIGCLILSDLFFFPDDQWIPAGPYWSTGVRQGHYLDLTRSPGAALWDEVRIRLAAQAPVATDEVADSDSAMFGEPLLVRRRLGQRNFQFGILDTYRRRCVVTDEKALPVLDAVHIRAVKEGGQHRLDNGLLLRSDVHRLFDAGYVTVTPEGRFRVSRRLKDEFDNGEPYFPFDGKELWLPPEPRERPGREFLEWHGDVVFRP